jgi:hypothetical protein
VDSSSLMPIVPKPKGEFWPLPLREVAEDEVRYSLTTARGSVELVGSSAAAMSPTRLHGFECPPHMIDLRLKGTARSQDEEEALRGIVFTVALEYPWCAPLVVPLGDSLKQRLQMRYADLALSTVCEVADASPISTAQLTSNTTGELQVHARWTRPPLWLSEVVSKINSFSLLRKNWDSYRARPISRTAMAEAFNIASYLARAEESAHVRMADPPFVAPMSTGGILLELKNGSRQLHIEIDPSLTSMYQISRIWMDTSGREVEEDTTIHESDLPGVLSWIFQTT